MTHSININTNKGCHDLLISTIIRVQGSSSYSKIFIADTPYPIIACKLLHWFEDNLYGKSFIRTHKSHLVNRQYIEKLCSNANRVELRNGETIAISKRKYMSVKKMLAVKQLNKKRKSLFL